MATTSNEARAAQLRQRIQDDLARGERRARDLRRANSGLILAILLTTAAATLLAGLAASGGPPIGEGTTAWRWTCGFIAVLTASSGLFTGAQQKFGVAERLAQVLACVARLRGLESSLSLSRRDVDEIARDYEEVVALYPEAHG